MAIVKKTPKSIGVDMGHVAKLLTDDRGSKKPTYGPVVAVPGLTNHNVSPQSSSEKFFEDNKLSETFVSTTAAQVTVSVGGTDRATLRAIYGYEALAANTLGVKGDFAMTPQLVAHGYRRMIYGRTTNGRQMYRYVWLAKLRFMPASEEGPTKGETTSVTPGSYQGDAMALDSFLPNELIWNYTMDNWEEGITQAHEDAFFTTVILSDEDLTKAVAALPQPEPTPPEEPEEPEEPENP